MIYLFLLHDHALFTILFLSLLLQILQLNQSGRVRLQASSRLTIPPNFAPANFINAVLSCVHQDQNTIQAASL